MKNSTATLPDAELLQHITDVRGQLLSLGRAATAAYDNRGGRTENELIREWKQQCLNYWRCIEIPACLAALSSPALPSGPVLDLGSPKLGALWLAKHLPNNQTIACDISDYFIADFDEIYKMLGLCNVESEVCDARCIPHASRSSAAVVSISVLEHIPDDGDSAAMAEIGRVLAPGGRVVVSVPYWIELLHEHVEPGVLYWEGFSSSSNSHIFYQRRYSYDDLLRRLVKPSGLSLKSLFLIAERPAFDDWGRYNDGQLSENWQFLKSTRLTRTVNRLSKLFPSLPQVVHRFYSHRLHRFTADVRDDQAMAAVLVLE